MSKEINGLPKKTFWSHLIRACEIAMPYQILLDEHGSNYEFGHPEILGMACENIIHLFDIGGYQIFRRKESKTLRLQRLEWVKDKKARRDVDPFCDDDKYGPWLTKEINDTEDAKTRRLLAPFDGSLDADFGEWVKQEK